jgi:hypothetical protein
MGFQGRLIRYDIPYDVEYRQRYDEMIAKIGDPYGKLVPGIASANDLVLNGPPAVVCSAGVLCHLPKAAVL